MKHAAGLPGPPDNKLTVPRQLCHTSTIFSRENPQARNLFSVIGLQKQAGLHLHISKN
jgi:hypothetical protein